MIKTIVAVLILTSAVTAAGWTVHPSPPPDMLAAEELRERAHRFFPGWPPAPCSF